MPPLARSAGQSEGSTDDSGGSRLPSRPARPQSRRLNVRPEIHKTPVAASVASGPSLQAGGALLHFKERA